jgi:hypothetical protein
VVISGCGVVITTPFVHPYCWLILWNSKYIYLADQDYALLILKNLKFKFKNVPFIQDYAPFIDHVVSQIQKSMTS